MRPAVACVLSICWLVGCGGGTAENAAQVKPAFYPDPAYVPKINDFAALFRLEQPSGLVPYVLDIEVYARIYDRLKSGQDDLIPKTDQSEIRWVPPGTEVKVLNIVDQNTMDMLTQHQDAQQRAAQKPWAKIVLVFPGTQETEIDHEKIGFTLIGYINRPLPSRK